MRSTLREKLAALGAASMARFDRVFAKKDLYARVFNTPDGRAVLADMARFSGYDKPCHVPGDSHSTAWNDGVRRPVVRIRRLLNMSEDEIFRMAQEVAEDG